MSLAAFSRMHASLLARLGEQASLQGVACRAIVEHGVEIIGDYGQVSHRVTTVTLPCALDPRIGQALLVGTVAYLLDAQLENDGFVAKFTVRRT